MKTTLAQRIQPLYSQEQPEPLVLQSLQMQQQQEGPGDQQQQQQQQQQQPSDPFEGIDLDHLPDDVRDAVVKARTNLQSLQNSNQTLTQQQQQLQQQIQQQQQRPDPRQQQQQQQQQREPETMDEELVQYYINEGLSEADAKKVAKMNGGMLAVFAKRFSAGMHQQLSPIVGRVIEDNAADAFESIRSNDPLGMLNIPEVAQATWERLQSLAQQGQLIDHNVASGLAKIYWTDYVAKNGGIPEAPPQNNPIDDSTIIFPGITPTRQQQNRQMQPIANPQGGPQFTYPGSGHLARVNTNSRNNGTQPVVYTAEERAAMAATVEKWPVKPKDFAPAKSTVTRGAA